MEAKSNNRIVASIASHSYGSGSPRLRHIELEFRGGEIAALFGISGVGKTTLVRVLLGIARGVTNGSVTYYKTQEGMTPQEACRKGLVGVLSDDAPLVPWLSVEENLFLPSRLNYMLPAPSAEHVSDVTARLGLDPVVLDQPPHELSFGMRHRVIAARTLLYRPSFLLLDEVFTGLDPVNATKIKKAIDSYVTDTAAVCLIVSHDIINTLSIAHLAYILSIGGSIEQVAANRTADEIVSLLELDSELGERRQEGAL